VRIAFISYFNIATNLVSFKCAAQTNTSYHQYLNVPCDMQSGKGWDVENFRASDVVRVAGKYRLKERIGSGSFGA
jgi:hypothetical protein